MAFSFIQSVQSTGSGTNSSLTVASTVQNNLLVINIKLGSNSETISSITDNVGNTYAKAFGPVDNGTTLRTYQFYGVQVTGGATTITINKSGTVNTWRTTVDEFNGGNITNATVFDKSSAQTNAGTSSALSTPIAPTTAGELIVSGVSFLTAPGSPVVATGYTIGTLGAATAGSQYKLSGTTSETAGMTWTGGTTWSNIVSAFIPRGNNSGFLAFM